MFLLHDVKLRSSLLIYECFEHVAGAIHQLFGLCLSMLMVTEWCPAGTQHMIVSQSRTVCLLLHQLISSLILFLNPSTIETLNPDLSQCILFDTSIFFYPGNHLQHALAVCSDDLTLMVWDTSADVSNSSGNGSTPWYFILILSFDAWISSLETCIMKSGSMICLGASTCCVWFLYSCE